LDRAQERIRAKRECEIAAIQSDLREASLPEESFDLVIAAAVLHHLRGEEEWRAVFQKIYRSLLRDGSLWISDLVSHAVPSVQSLMWRRYGEYLAALKGIEYRDHVFAYVDHEDSPRPVTFQLDLMREVGFRTVDILHKNSCFAAFVGFK
jgi:tRNA (cmo5U34)-methyltransferase